MLKPSDEDLVREGLRVFNRYAGVLQSNPYGLELTLSQASALVDIERAQIAGHDLRAGELGAILNLEKSSVSRMLAQLLDRGLIRVLPHPVDGRAKLLALTKSGARQVATINEVSNRHVGQVLGILSAEDRHLMARAFARLAAAVNSLGAADR